MAKAIAFLFCFSLLIFCSSCAVVSPSPGRSSNATADELALLSFKSALSSNPLLDSWNTSSPYCAWQGVKCGRRHPERVIWLRLPSFNLSGRIPPSLGNLTFLRRLSINDNHFTGPISPELGRLTRLQRLNLSSNSLQGPIPAAMEGCTRLMLLDISHNNLRGTVPLWLGLTLKNLNYLYLEVNSLSGEIPPTLAELPSIQVLALGDNKLSGEIPPSLGNLTSLQELYLYSNKLSGPIPPSLGQLHSISWLNLAFNNLDGEIPSSIWNMSSLAVFSVEYNMLSGVIPQNAFEGPLLAKLVLSHNHFHGYIPASVANASHMSLLELDENFFSGIVPPEIGMLRELNFLVLWNNLFEAREAKDWEFITALSNCSQLQFLLMAGNKLGGALPGSLSNLSTSLKLLDLSENSFTGSIPEDIGNLVNLHGLYFSHNSLTGSLPSSLNKLTNLGALKVSDNSLHGTVPLAIQNLTELTSLDLSMNAFSGRVPWTLGSLTKLSKLVLGNNNFTGSIPLELFRTPKQWLTLDLSHNDLEGSIPEEIGNLKGLLQLSAGWNKLSGKIPSTLGKCLHLQNLSLQNNALEGSIPAALSQLKGLEILDLSCNNLSGKVPGFLGNIGVLYYLNLSFNSFVGEVPTVGVFLNTTIVSVQGNINLCGGISDLHLPPCALQSPWRRHKFVVILATSLVTILVILSLLLYKLLNRYKNNKAKIPSMRSIQGHPMISYSQLLKATNGFSTANLLGSGSFGSVYKGQLDGQVGDVANVVAVKVLKLQARGALKSFIAECEALRNLRHRNLVKIITACSSIDTRGNEFKAIVFDFMPNGSLHDWLHPDNDQTEQKYLNLLDRVTILLDVANALDYLHCHGPAPVVHCDLKPGNVLLDAEMAAHVGVVTLQGTLERLQHWQSPRHRPRLHLNLTTTSYMPLLHGATTARSTQIMSTSENSSNRSHSPSDLGDEWSNWWDMGAAIGVLAAHASSSSSGCVVKYGALPLQELTCRQ